MVMPNKSQSKIWSTNTDCDMYANLVRKLRLSYQTSKQINTYEHTYKRNFFLSVVCGWLCDYVIMTIDKWNIVPQ